MAREVEATCPCCGYVVFNEPPGSYAICPVCFWEDDEVQLRFPSLAGGANKVSLIEAQNSFQRLNVSEKRFTENVRAPLQSERRDPEWRPINPTVDQFEAPFTADEEFTPYPEDFTTLYYWRDNYWRHKQQK